MENKQTAVEWLINEIRLQISRSEKLDYLLNKAKEMEKEQIINSYNDGFLNYQICNSKQYYKQTYGEI